MKINKTNAVFAAGVAVGVSLFEVLKTKKVRELTVNTLANGRILKDKVLEEVSNIREESDDIYEAKKIETNSTKTL